MEIVAIQLNAFIARFTKNDGKSVRSTAVVTLESYFKSEVENSPELERTTCEKLSTVFTANGRNHVAMVVKKGAPHGQYFNVK